MPTVIQFVAKVPGRFELELHHAGRAARPADGPALITALLPRVLAHGIGGVQDLPVPTWLFYWGGAVVLVVSFVALGALWKTPQLAQRAGGRALGGDVQPARARAGADRRPGALGGPLRRRARRRAVRRRRDPFENLAPTWVYVIFWLGLPLLSLLFGNVWRALSPWRALADAFVWVVGAARAARRDRSRRYPERLGRYPGAVALFAFVALELCYSDPVEPAGARVCDRALLLRRALRHARLRARDVDRAWGGLRDPVRVHRPDRAARRSRRADPAAAAAHRARRRRARAGLGRRSSPSRSARSASTATAARSPGRT